MPQTSRTSLIDDEEGYHGHGDEHRHNTTTTASGESSVTPHLAVVAADLGIPTIQALRYGSPCGGQSIEKESKKKAYTQDGHRYHTRHSGANMEGLM